MKKIILGTFASRPGAESLINHLRQDLHVPQDDISCIYRDERGKSFEVFGDDVEEELTPEMKRGALIGAVTGFAVGVSVLISALPALIPFLTANPVVMTVGIITSSAGIILMSVLCGVVIGSGAGWLFSRKESDDETEVATSTTGVLVVAHARDDKQVGKAFTFYGASVVEVYTPTFS